MAGNFQLYLVRHAVAEERGEAWPDDTKRPLTERGMTRMRRAVRGLVSLGVEIDVVLTSPLVRARQTAEILAGGFDPRPPVVNVEALAPGATWQALASELAKQTRRERIALVGHEPGIGELAAQLIGARQPIEFKKGAICRIDVEALPPTAAGSLRWFMTARTLRRIK